jgi:hypothetical protein
MFRSLLSACLLTPLLLAATPAHATVRAYAGAVAGNAGNGTLFGCATSGPSIAAPWFAGIGVPTEGIAPCGLSGGIEDRTAASGPITASMSAVGPMVGNVGTFTGSAQARADHWSLGVAAEGRSTGGSSSMTYRQAAAFASFSETVLYTSPTVAAGTAGSTNFSFLIDGLLKSQPNAPYSQQGDIALSIRINDGTGIWTSFAGTVINDRMPFLRGGGSFQTDGFALSPGAFEGSARVTSTANFGFVWGTPFKVEIALLTSVSPCCYGTALASDFYNTAQLDGIDAFAGGRKIIDFEVGTSAGYRLGAAGVMARPVPEPGTYGMAALGLCLVAAATRRRGRH